MGFFANLWNGIKNGVSNVWNRIKDTATSVWHNHIKPIVSRIPLVGDRIVSGVESVGNAINRGANAVGQLAQGNVSGAVSEGKGAYNDVKGGINQLANLKKGGKVGNMRPTVQGGTHSYVVHDGIPQNSFQR